MPDKKEKKAPKTIVSNSGNAFTVIEDYEDGTDPKGRQTQMTRMGQQTVEFVMTKWPLWNAIVNTFDVEFVRRQLSDPEFKDINLQQKEHPVYHGKTYLIAAVQANQLEIVTLLLDNGADPNLLDDTDKTAMHYAIILNYRDLFELLIKSPRTNVNQVINNNNALLHVLMSDGKKEWAELLVENGADINLHTTDLATPLVQTLAGSQVDCALWLLGLGADVKPGFDGISPMCFAASSGLVDLMQSLLEKGASLEKEEYVTTPLISAARNNKVEAVNWLLEKGVDVNAEDNQGETAIMQGACNIDIVHALLEKGAKIDATKSPQRYLFNAATNGSSKSLTLFLETYKMDANTTNDVGQTAISEAATCDASDSSNTVEHIDVLIRNGADVNKGDSRRGTTPLLHAVFNRKLDNISRLLQAGANPNAQDVDGLTPLHMACGRGYLEEAKLLVAAGGDVNLKDSNGETPADYAAGTFTVAALTAPAGGSPTGSPGNSPRDKKKECIIS